MGRLRYGLQNVERSVYKSKDLFDGVVCSECGGSHFKFIQETKIGPFPFYVYQCVNPKCGDLVFMDYDTMLDHPMSGKAIPFAQKSNTEIVHYYKTEYKLIKSAHKT